MCGSCYGREGGKAIMEAAQHTVRARDALLDRDRQANGGELPERLPEDTQAAVAAADEAMRIFRAFHEETVIAPMREGSGGAVLHLTFRDGGEAWERITPATEES